jgi:hypothetical protein
MGCLLRSSSTPLPLACEGGGASRHNRAIVFINLIANLGGFVGPHAIGLLDVTGSYVAGILVLVAGAIISGVILPCLRVR